MNKIILASASPRRKALLKQLGFHPMMAPVDIDESHLIGELPQDYVSRLAIEKAQSRQKKDRTGFPVLGADTIVVLNDQLLGKPKNKKEAARTLNQLAGQKHFVYSAVAIVWHNQFDYLTSISEVTFADISEDEIQSYVNSGEPMDKAGCYGIQGTAAQWIKHLSGSYSGVMGLPLYETAQICKKLAIIMPTKN